MAVQPFWCGTWSETPKTGFLTTRLMKPLYAEWTFPSLSNGRVHFFLGATEKIFPPFLFHFSDDIHVSKHNSPRWNAVFWALHPSQHFSVMSGRNHRFLGINFWEVNVSCSRIQHGDPSEDRTPDLSLRSPTLYH